MVQIERRVQAWWRGKPYVKRYRFVPIAAISRDLQHAVVAAEDARFYSHHGFDWQEMRKTIEKTLDEDRRLRGASTITQQLVKNLYLTTRRSHLRKAVELALTPIAEPLMGKQRVLELYLNVAEWGPGVYGAEAAARHHYGISAKSVNREQAARLAACLPAPLKRQPERMHGYAAEILTRMRQMGW
jgi:monofunctional biosynthetic peptidoglycan transglycosylase